MLKKIFIYDVDFFNDKKVRVIRFLIEYSDFIFFIRSVSKLIIREIE